MANHFASLVAGATLFLASESPGGASTRTVTNLNDSGLGSLRHTVSIATSGDTIDFSVHGLIILTSGEITIGKSLNIVGPADFNIGIISNQENRMLHITTGTVALKNLDVYSGGAIGDRGADGSAGNNNGSAGAEADGGGLYNSGNVTLTNCNFSSNIATGGSGGTAYADGRGGDGAPGRGGAIFNEGTAALIQCTFSNNRAGGGNAGDAGNYGLDGDGGNGASGEGGAIFNAGDMSLVNCTFSTNYSTGGFGGRGLVGGEGGEASGGGIFQASGSNTCLNTVLAQNTLNSGSGGGNVDGGGSAPDGASIGPDTFGTIESLGHNLVGISNGSTGWVESDLRGTETAPLDPMIGPSYVDVIMPLLPGSPAIDAGDDSVQSAPYNVAVDPREFPRHLGAHVDIGAFEFDLPQPGPNFIITTLHDHLNESAGIYDCTLGEAILASTPFSNSVITFAPDVRGTLQLLPVPNNDNPGAHFYIDHPVQIKGPGADVLTIRGGAKLGTIFTNAGPDVSISGLTMAGGQGGSGAAIHNFGGLAVKDCAFTDNGSVPDGSVTPLGGAILNSSGPGDTWLIVSNCTFNRNIATDAGGAIASFAVTTVANCTFNDNIAPKGGALYADSYPGYFSDVSIQSCTISSNSATGGENHGGGVYAASGRVEVENSIIARNTALAGGPDVFGVFTSSGNNLIGISDINAEGFFAGVNNDKIGSVGSPIDPRLGTLFRNGGPTLTMALLSDSAAINSGANSPDRDQRGYVRPDTPDIGAFEFNGTIPVILANISTRVRVETDDNVLIGGFIITGSHTKKVVLRALGPSLPLTGALADPFLELYDSSGAVQTTNDNWSTNANQQEIIDAGFSPPNALESAILTELAPGAYTAIVRGVENATGVALVEVYDLDRTIDAKLANISTRGLVWTGDAVMIAGFIVLGPDDQQVIIRAIGPSLPLADQLSDPILELHDGNGGIVTTNDNWRSTQEDEIIATGIPPTNDFEAAVVATLRPGAYTAIVRGNGNATGGALVEVYALN